MIPGVSTIKVQLSGLRPMMFDRYPGDNSTTLPTAEKMYLTKDRYLTLPALNLFSLLVGENTKSVCRQFWGKNGKTIALGISAYCNIEPFEIPIEDDNGPIQFVGFNEQISIHRAVARLKNGIPNPERPALLGTPLAYSVQHHVPREQVLHLGELAPVGSHGRDTGTGVI